jgi:hypothetical protein
MRAEDRRAQEAERQRLTLSQQEQKQKSKEPDKLASVRDENGHTGNAASCVAKARAMLRNYGGVTAIAIGATDCGYSTGSAFGRQGAEMVALRNCRRKTTGCQIID